MDAVSLLREQVKQAHEVVEGTVSDLTPEQIGWKPGGNANPPAALLNHLTSGEDFFLKMMTGQQPLAMGPYAGKTGASEPHPMGNYGEWAQSGSRSTFRKPSTTCALYSEARRSISQH